MRFRVGQWVKVLGPYYYGNGAIARIVNIDSELDYPILIEGTTWRDTVTTEGCLYEDEPKDSVNSVYIEPLTKLERLLLGLE